LLSNYDANSLSTSDAQEIVQSLQDANISPSEALASTMSAAGFDAKNIGDLAGVGQNSQGQRPMGPPPPKTEEMSTISDLLDSLLNSNDTQKFIVNSLSQILQEPGNYNRMSFYA